MAKIKIGPWVVREDQITAVYFGDDNGKAKGQEPKSVSVYVGSKPLFTVQSEEEVREALRVLKDWRLS